MSIRRVLPAFAIAMATGLLPTAQASAQGAVPEITVHAHAAGSEVKSEAIKTADLDLTKEAGAETLIGRIRSAAGRICMPLPSHPGNFKDVSDYEKCKSEAIEGAVRDSGSAKAVEIIQRTGD